MKNWMESLTENELEVMRVTLRASVQSDEIGCSTRQNAKMLLEQVEDFLWVNVCKNEPAQLEQNEIELV